jgi:hypothetical protein
MRETTPWRKIASWNRSIYEATAAPRRIFGFANIYRVEMENYLVYVSDVKTMGFMPNKKKKPKVKTNPARRRILSQYAAKMLKKTA